MTYKKYDPLIKKMIIESRNPNLFPELRIPRTTALYWIHHAKEINTVLRPAVFENEVNHLKKELFHQRAVNHLLSELLNDAFKAETLHSLYGTEIRRKVVEVVESIKGLIPLNETLRILGISQSSFYRFKAEVLGCRLTSEFCDPRRPNQLSKREQDKMVSLALDPKFAHMSVKSLMYYAQREKALFCGLDSWYKYLKLNKVVRPFQRHKKRKQYRKGIRANHPNEIWHIDITEIRTVDGEKLYIQMIVDNFSRAIVSWKIGKFKNLKLSLKSINSALKNNSTQPEILLSDGGKENTNNKVQKLLLGRGICQLVAKSDVLFSNSMIEAVFRQLKKNPKIKSLHSVGGLRRYVSKFVKSYNLDVPHSSLQGARPNELLENNWDQDEFNREVRLSRSQIRLMRAKEFKNCQTCLKL